MISQEPPSHSNTRRISNIATHKFTKPFPMLYQTGNSFSLHAKTYGQHFLYCNNLGHRRTFPKQFHIKTQLHPTILSSSSPRPQKHQQHYLQHQLHEQHQKQQYSKNSENILRAAPISSGARLLTNWCVQLFDVSISEFGGYQDNRGRAKDPSLS